MNITYKRINKSAGNYEVLLDEKNVGSVIGQTKKWELKNLFGTIISKGITRDLAVKNALESLWEYELEFELFHDQKSSQEKNEETTETNQEENFVKVSENTEENASKISPENTGFLKLNEEKVDESIEIIEENNLLDSEPKLGDDYQPMEKESNFNKCTRIINNSFTKIKEYANKIGIY